MPIKPDDIARLIQLFQDSEWDELHVEIGGMQLFLSTDPAARLYNTASAPLIAPAAAERRPSPSKPQLYAAADIAIPPTWKPVKAPNLGTFYRSPKPGAKPFVEIGQRVTAETEICLLEVMKLFTTVKAGANGIVRKICANDAELVEGEQVLFYLEQD